MKKFQFNLESVLKVREREEKLSLQEFERARRDVIELKQYLAKLEQERNEVKTQPEQLCSITDVENTHYYFQDIKRQIAEKQDDLMRLNNIMEERRQALAAKSKDRKVLENLKEKSFAEWQQEFRRVEQNNMDEIAVTRFIRQQEGEGNEC